MSDIATLGIKVDSTDVGLADKALVNLTNTANKLVGAIKGVVAAYLGWQAIKSIIVDSALLNARFETMGVVLNVVGRNAGYSAQQMQSYEVSLRKTGIAMIEARETLTRMSQAQLDLTKTSALARVAQDAAVVGGINSSAAFERMVQGIRTGETETLRTIGINVNFQQSYQSLAKELKKTTDQLTEAEKSQARMNSVLLEGAKLNGVYEAAMGTAGKQLQSMKRYTDDLKVKFGEVFNEALTMSVFGLTGALKDAHTELDILAQDKQLETWAHNLSDSIAFTADVIGSLAAAARKAGIDFAHEARKTDIKRDYTDKAGLAFWGKVGRGEFGDLFNQRELDKQRAAALKAEEAFYAKEVEINAKGFTAVRDLVKKNRQQKARDIELGVGTFAASDLARQASSFGISTSGEQAKLLSKQDADLFLEKPTSAPTAASSKSAAVDKIKSHIAALKEEAATLGLSSDALRRYELAQLKMTPVQQKLANGYIKQIELFQATVTAAQEHNAAWDETFSVLERDRLLKEEAIQTQRLWLESIALEKTLLGKTNEEREIELRLMSLRKAGVADASMEANIRQSTYASAGQQYLRSAYTQQDLFEEERKRVDTIYKEGGFGSPESLDAMEKYSISVGAVNEKYKALGTTIVENNDAARQLGMTFSSAFESAILSGKSLREVLAGLARDVYALFIRKTATEPLANMLSGAFSSGLGSLFGGSAAVPSNIASFGSMDFNSISAFSTTFADGGIMTPSGRVPIRKYSAGGIARSPQAAIFAENSVPEAYVPVPSGKIPVEISGSMPAPSISVTQHFDFRNADSSVEPRLRAEAERIKRETLSELMDNLTRGGAFASATGRR